MSLPTVSLAASADITFTSGVNFFAIPPRSFIGDIAVDCSVSQRHTDRLEITENPVQRGAEITDHSYKVPAQVLMRCGWSNAGSRAQQIRAPAASFSGGSMTASDYISRIYSQLLALQDSRQPIKVTTLRRTYDNMLIKSLELEVDQHTAEALLVEVHLQEIILTDVASTTFPPQSDQAQPASTAEVQNVGTQNTTPATPAPGGAAPPSSWGASLIDAAKGSVSSAATAALHAVAPQILGIPLQIGTPQSLAISLGGVDYNVALRYRNAPEGGGWSVDVADSGGNPMLSGIPLVTGVDLLGQFPDLGFNGELRVQTTSDPDAVPTFENLGADAQIYWVAKGS